MKDLMHELNMVERRVGDGQVPAGPARVVTLSRTYAAPLEDVWDALTDAERLSRWFLPVSGDLRLGGRFSFEGNAGGVIRECDEPHRILATWEMGEPGPADTSLVEVRLVESDGGTRLELEHRAQVPPEMWEEFGPGALGVGWDGGLLGLALHLAGVPQGELGASQDEIAANPALRTFNTASARQWGLAQRAAGVDGDTVEANVAATTAFYVPADG